MTGCNSTGCYIRPGVKERECICGFQAMREAAGHARGILAQAAEAMEASIRAEEAEVALSNARAGGKSADVLARESDEADERWESMRAAALTALRAYLDGGRDE
jgi:hypothetical protein